MKLQLVNASVQKPSNVALYFSLDDKEGNPTPGVKAEQFNIFEDGQLISAYESKQTILNPEVVIERYTLLLLDMSGSVVDSGQVPVIQEAVHVFLENIGANEEVAIFAFDGREKIIPIARFGAREEALARKNELLSAYEPEDPSTNLNGAIIEAAKVLEKKKKSSDAPLSFGTVVIFSDGTDRAHRATGQEALDSLKAGNIRSFVIGLAGEVDAAQLERYGQDGYVHAKDHDWLVDSFRKVADTINAQALRYYLLSYCSPSRAGTHELTVLVELEDQKGKLDYEFDAEGFGPGCDPNDTPRFSIPDSKDETVQKKAESEGVLVKKGKAGKRTRKNKARKAEKREDKNRKKDNDKSPSPAGIY